MLQLDDFAAYLDSKGKSERTVKEYRDRARDFLEWTQGKAITVKMIRDFVQYCTDTKRYAPAGTNVRLSAVRAYCAWLVETKKARSNPALEVKPVKAVRGEVSPDVLNDDELARFLEAVHKGNSLRDITIVRTLLHTGVRISELLALERTDVDLDTCLMTVRHGKGNKYREIPMVPELCDYLRDYMKAEPEGRTVFNMTRVGVSHMLKKYASQVGIKRIHPHLFRHQLATELVRNRKTDFSTVAGILGHARLETVLVYTKPSRRDKALALTGAFQKR